MSVLTPKRLFLVVASLLFAAVALANNPSPRTHARMQFDARTGEIVLFGGRSNLDSATGVIHSSNETWLLSGSRWAQRFPAHSPAGRSAHSMVYDSTRGRVVMFGGRAEAVDLDSTPVFFNDTWVWQNGDWTQIETATAPSPRHNAGLAYDSARDVIILFGGLQYTADGKLVEPAFDTWEFDGTNWTRVADNSDAKVTKPELAYDASRNQTLMIAIDSTLAPKMYVYDTAAHTWNAPSPAPDKLPTCANEGVLDYDSETKTVLFVGGTCATGTTTDDETWQWNGTTWTKLTTNSLTKATGQAFTYDAATQRFVMFGGVTLGEITVRSTVLTFRSNTWSFLTKTVRPRPRSLASMRTDTARGTVWLFGGLDEYSSGYTRDFWRYDGANQWFPITLSEAEATSLNGCVTPASAFDSQRQKLVLFCFGTAVHEWDGATFKEFADLKTSPSTRRFAGAAYDENLKKVVMYGGYDDQTGNFRNDTWTWDGTTWAEVKNNRPPHRSLMSMWYDKTLRKVVMYGGVGRGNLDQKVTRFDDMWSFDGTGWTKMNVTTTPGPRLGAQIAVDPTTGNLLLFGGLRAEVPEDDDEATRQFFDNDTWLWNTAGQAWTKITVGTAPPPRENGMMTWDPALNEIVLFGGYNAGLYLSDVWSWNGQQWTLRLNALGRHRAAGH